MPRRDVIHDGASLLLHRGKDKRLPIVWNGRHDFAEPARHCKHDGEDKQEHHADKIRASIIAPIYVGIREAEHHDKNQPNNRKAKQNVIPDVAPGPNRPIIRLNVVFVEFTKVPSHGWAPFGCNVLRVSYMFLECNTK